MITAEPFATAVTTPLATVATVGALELHVTVVAIPGSPFTAATSVEVPPTVSATLVVLSAMVIGCELTLSASVADFVESTVDVAVIVAVPAATAVTTPAALIVATDALLLLHETVCGSPASAVTVAVSVRV